METPVQAAAAGLRVLLRSLGVSQDRALVSGRDTVGGYAVTLRYGGDHDVVRALLEDRGWLVLSAGPTELFAWPPEGGPQVDAPTQLG